MEKELITPIEQVPSTKNGGGILDSVGAAAYSAANSALMGLPDLVVGAVGGEEASKKLADFKESNKAASTVGDLASFLIPGAGIVKGTKSIAGGGLADRLFKSGRLLKSTQKNPGVTKTTGTPDVAKSAPAHMQRSGSLQKENPVQSNPMSSGPDYSLVLSGEKEVPEGWFVHGRSPEKAFGNSDTPTLFSRDIPTAKMYAGKQGDVWMSRPMKNSDVADFSSPYSDDMNKFVSNLRPYFDKGTVPEINAVKEQFANALGVGGDSIGWEAFERELRKAFSPRDIVNSAEAFDDDVVWSLLDLYKGKWGSWPDFVMTPNGAVSIPGRSSKLENINLTNLSKMGKNG